MDGDGIPERRVCRLAEPIPNVASRHHGGIGLVIGSETHHKLSLPGGQLGRCF